MRKLLIIHFVLASLLLTACAQQKIPGVYRIDIQQGNVVTQDMLDRLETGMEERKVRYLLGTPLIVDTFNNDRWDYLYSFQPGGGERVQRRISLFFAEGKLARMEGDIRPSVGQRAESRRKETVVTVPDSEEDGLLQKLTDRFRKKDKKKMDPAASDETAVAAEGEEAEEEGFMSRWGKRLGLDSKDEEAKTEPEAKEEPAVTTAPGAPPIDPTPVPPAVTDPPVAETGQAQTAEEIETEEEAQSGLFSRLKKKLGLSDEGTEVEADPETKEESAVTPAPETPPVDQAREATAPPAVTDPPVAEAGKEQGDKEVEPEDKAQGGLFSSLKKKLGLGDESAEGEADPPSQAKETTEIEVSEPEQPQVQAESIETVKPEPTKESDEGLFSNWRKRLGLDQDGPADKNEPAEATDVPTATETTEAAKPKAAVIDKSVDRQPPAVQAETAPATEDAPSDDGEPTDTTGTAPVMETTAPKAVVIDRAVEQPSTQASPPPVQAETVPAAKDEDGGFFRRLSRRLGLEKPGEKEQPAVSTDVSDKAAASPIDVTKEESAVESEE